MNTRSKSRQRSQKRSQRGGSQGSYPDSAWGFQMNNLGDGWTQFTNSLTGNNPNNQSNVIVQNHPKMMNGGKKRRSSRGKRGGYFGTVLEHAAVPLALLGAQQYYGKRHTRKHTGRSRSFRRRH
jgi:hypothetical protein